MVRRRDAACDGRASTRRRVPTRSVAPFVTGQFTLGNVWICGRLPLEPRYMGSGAALHQRYAVIGGVEPWRAPAREITRGPGPAPGRSTPDVSRPPPDTALRILD